MPPPPPFHSRRSLLSYAAAEDDDIESDDSSSRGDRRSAGRNVWWTRRVAVAVTVASVLLLLLLVSLTLGIRSQQETTVTAIDTLSRMIVDGERSRNITVTVAARAASFSFSEYGIPPTTCNVRLSGLRAAGQVARKEETAVTAAFDHVYSSGQWTSEGGGSGTGSSLEVTARIRSILRTVINQYNVRTMLDAPCGAMVWMPLLLEEVEDDLRLPALAPPAAAGGNAAAATAPSASAPTFTYYGVDAVEKVVLDAAARLLPTHPNWSLHALDLSRTVFCDEKIDLIFSRDALQHLNCSLTVDLLAGFAQSSARLLLVGSYPTGENKNIPNGWYFPIDLRQPPYSLTEGLLHVYNEWTDRLINEAPKQALLYDMSALRKIDWAAVKAKCPAKQA